MKRTICLVFLATGLAFSSGCSWGAAGFQRSDGMAKASFDLGCDESLIKVRELSEMSVGVSGCGRRARYELMDGQRWLLNSKIESAE